MINAKNVRNSITPDKVDIGMIAHDKTFVMDFTYVKDITFIKEWKNSIKELNCPLFLTDDPDKGRKARKEGYGVLIYLHEGNSELEFPDFRFFIEGFEDADAEYLEHIYMREKKLPWTIAETERLIIREMTIKDTDALYELYRDKSVVAYMDDLYEDSKEEREYIRAYIERFYILYEYGIWLIIKKDTGEVIGRVGFENGVKEDTVELGFLIAPKYQRKGYAMESCRAALAYMEEKFPDFKIYARCYKENKAAIALCEKLGVEVRYIK